MRLRPYIQSRDYNVISSWIMDRREHAMWCADRFRFPVERENLNGVLEEHALKFGDCAFAATDDSGLIIGFFCYSLNTENNEGMLKFVVTDPSMRGKGIGKEMLRLAIKYAFEITKADVVRLCVFAENIGAVKCYERVGFSLISIDADIFDFGDEKWSRCNMIIKKEQEWIER